MHCVGRLLALLLVLIGVASTQTPPQANLGAVPIDRLGEP